MSSCVLDLRQVKRHVGAAEIVRGVDLSLREGERMALIGPNGAGKTTLFNLISGRDPLTDGQIFFHEELISGLPPHKIACRGLARSFQVSNIFAQLTVADNLRCSVMYVLGYRTHFWQRLSQQHAIRKETERLLDLIGLQNQKNQLAGELSYAEQRALEIGMTIASGASCLLLDEPTAGMNRTEAQAVIALIRKVSEGKSLLMIEHDMQIVFELADRIAVMVYGKIIACDTPEKIRSNAQVNEAYLGVFSSKAATA